TANLLWTGHLQTGVTPEQFNRVLENTFKRRPLHIPGTAKVLRQFAWCSGAAQDYIEDAYRLGVDAYLSVEISERTFYQAQELGIHYFACGHHATERDGIKALGELLSQRFKLHHQFLDSVNPV